MDGLECEILASTGSTQDAARERVRAGQRAPFAVATGDQRSGRGRLGRSWRAAPGDGLALTVAHRSPLPPSRRRWYPLAVGVAALDVLRRPGWARLPGPDATSDVDRVGGAAGADHAAPAQDPDRLGLKWPNDLHTADGRKLAGILVEGEGPDHVLLGIGVNLRGPVRDETGAELRAAWLGGPGGLRPSAPPLADLAREIATAIHAELAALDNADGDALVAGLSTRYDERCITVGHEVRVSRAEDPNGVRPHLHGLAERIDAEGRLVVLGPDGRRSAVEVGDVHHVRPA